MPGCFCSTKCFEIHSCCTMYHFFLLFFLNCYSIHSILWIECYSSIDGHLVCFQFGVSVSMKSAFKDTLTVFCGQMFSFFLGKYPGIELLDHGVDATFYDTAFYFPKWLFHFLFPPAKKENSKASASSPRLGVISLLNWSYSHFMAILTYTSDGEY